MLSATYVEVLPSLMPKKTEARTPGGPRKAETKLAKWLDENSKTRQWLADKLGVSLRQVHRLCNGDSRPSLENACVIEKLTGGRITMQDWC